MQGSEDPAEERAIDLQMIATSLTEGRPYNLPCRLDRYYFKSDEMARYFPPHVVEWMEKKTRPGAKPFPHLHALPPIGDLPVVVATRLSLSFPLLAQRSAVLRRRLCRRSGGHSAARLVFGRRYLEQLSDRALRRAAAAPSHPRDQPRLDDRREAPRARTRRGRRRASATRARTRAAGFRRSIRSTGSSASSARSST